MFANRYTAFIDACALTGVLKRNLLLSLAEAEFFRVRWSSEVLGETKAAIEGILQKRGIENASDRASNSIIRMKAAFEDALVTDYHMYLSICRNIPDEDDWHVLAAALKAQAAVLVTDNIKDFPSKILDPLNIEVRTTDAFLADTIALDPGRAVAAIKRMRERFAKPSLNAAELLRKMEVDGLTLTADSLRSFVQLI